MSASIVSILLDGSNVDKADLRSYLHERLEGEGEIETLLSSADGVSAMLFTRSAFPDAPVTVGMLGGPEANFGYNFGYDGSTHTLFDPAQNAWSFTISPTAGVCLQFIPAGTNTPGGGLDPWQFRGRKPWQVDEDGAMFLGGSISTDPTDFSAGASVELANAGTGIWGASKTVNVISNYYYDGADKFAGSGEAGYYAIGAGVHRWFSSTGAGAAAGDAATMTERMNLSAAGVLTLSAYGGGGGVISVGAADSGGSGYKLLRVPN